MNELHIDPRVFDDCTCCLIYGNDVETSATRRAFPYGGRLRLQLVLPRRLATSAAAVGILCDDGGETSRCPLHWSHLDGKDEVWVGEVDTSRLRIGLFFLRAEFSCILGEMISSDRKGMSCSIAPFDGITYPYQLTLFRFDHPTPEWLLGGTIYQIFPDRFFRAGNEKPSAGVIINPDWDNGIPQYAPKPGAPLKNNMFFGGDIPGITAKLDYLASLGVTCLYLCPIFRAASNHKYDTGNYMEIDPMFGDEDSLRELIAEAKSRGIRVILDGVFNHTGDDSLYFNKYGNYPSVGAYQSEDSPYHDWYRFRHFPDDYECWWNIAIHPRLNTDAPSCRRYFLGDGGVIDHWAKMGIGGFRLDVVDELNDSFVAGIRSRLTESCPGSVLYGEVWEDASNKISYDKRRQYFWGRELDGVMNYVVRTGLIEYVRNRDPEGLRIALTDTMANVPKRVQDLQMNLLGTHDTMRILTALAAQPEGGRTNQELAKARMTQAERSRGYSRLRVAYLILATIPGVPMIYYGDEIGMEGYHDPFNRMPFAWHDQKEEVLSFYKAVGELRRSHPVYRDGAFRLIHLDHNLLVFTREGGDGCYLTVVNVSDNPVRWHPDGRLTPLLLTHPRRANGVLAPMSGGVWFSPKPIHGRIVMTLES